MRETFEDRLDDLSSTTLDEMARIKERQADELDSEGIRSKNNSRVAIRIRLILEQRGWSSPALPKSSTKAIRTADQVRVEWIWDASIKEYSCDR